MTDVHAPDESYAETAAGRPPPPATSSANSTRMYDFNRRLVMTDRGSGRAQRHPDRPAPAVAGGSGWPRRPSLQ